VERLSSKWVSNLRIGEKIDRMIPFGGETFSGFTLSRPKVVFDIV
jgi:hypothetical protein